MLRVMRHERGRVQQIYSPRCEATPLRGMASESTDEQATTGPPGRILPRNSGKGSQGMGEPARNQVTTGHTQKGRKSVESENSASGARDSNTVEGTVLDRIAEISAVPELPRDWPEGQRGRRGVVNQKQPVRITERAYVPAPGLIDAMAQRAYTSKSPAKIARRAEG